MFKQCKFYLKDSNPLHDQISQKGVEMKKNRIFQVLGLVGLLLILSTTLVSAATFLLLVTGRGTVEGTPSEWGTFDTANPYYLTDLCVAGDCAGQAHVGRLFMHYTCENDMIYFAVTATSPLTYTASTSNLLAQNTIGNVLLNDAPPYNTNTDQNGPVWRDFTSGASGFEAGFPFARASIVTLTVQALINTTSGGQPVLTSTGFHTFVMPTCVPTAVTLSDFHAQQSAPQSDWKLGLVGILGLIGVSGIGLFMRRSHN
jgi:hypothetical protein